MSDVFLWVVTPLHEEDTSFWNIGNKLPDHTASQPRIPRSINCILCIGVLYGSLSFPPSYLPGCTEQCNTLLKWNCTATRHVTANEERSYNFYSALDGCESSASRPGCALSSGKDTSYPLDRMLGGTQCWSLHRLEEKFFASAGDQTPVVQIVVRYYTDWPTPAAV
jgi:hypothetical protein